MKLRSCYLPLALAATALTTCVLLRAASAGDSLELLIRGHLDQGLAEFNVYDARIPRYGEMRNAVVTHVWVKEPWDAKRGIKAVSPGAADFEALKLNQVISFQTGLYRYEQMWSGFWNTHTAALVKFSLTHHEACGNTYKQARFNQDMADYSAFSYFEGEGEARKQISLPEDALFYDELPLRLRMMAFAGSLASPVIVPLFPSVIHAKIDELKPQPATISQSADAAGGILFTVQHPGGSDLLTYAPEPPHRLISWQRADGGSLTLRKSLLIDYWNKTGTGDEAILDSTR